MKFVTDRRQLRSGRALRALQKGLGLGVLLGGLAPSAWAMHAGVAKGEEASRHRPEVVRQWSSRYHAVCPLPRPSAPAQRPTTISVDSPAEWASTLPGTDVRSVAGKEVRWSRERVILYAPPAGRTLTELTGPPRGLWLSNGSLYWPVQERPGAVAHKGDRSCLVSVVSRAYWMRIKVIDPALVKRH